MANYKNPNGYGSVTKLSGNRRNPFMVKKTIGYDDRAYPIYQIIGYYHTRKEAMIALAEFNQDPYDVDFAKITFKELYEKWSETEMPKLSKSNAYCHRAAYKYCKDLYDKPYRDIRKYDMQHCIDNCGMSYSTQAQIRSLFTTLDKYAYDQDIIRKCYSVNLTTAQIDVQKKRTVFTDEEVRLLHQHESEPYVDETLFLLYTGCRISEMLLMKCEDIDLEQGIMRGGVKTEAGKNRVIPIHEKLIPIIKRHLSENELLFPYERNMGCIEPERCLKTKITKAWSSEMKKLGIHHTTHECRHTFRSKLDSADANKVCIDLIMGHKTANVGERVYTHKTIEELKTAISLLSYGL